MTAPPIRATALFFDDVRVEATGKPILIGQYIGDMYILDNVPPADRLAIVLDVRMPRDYLPTSCAARIVMPGQPEPIVQPLVRPEAPDYTEKPLSPFSGSITQCILQIRFPPLRVGDRIDVWFVADGHDFPAGRLNVMSPKSQPHVGGIPVAVGI
jgi:hypothetical protein